MTQGYIFRTARRLINTSVSADHLVWIYKEDEPTHTNESGDEESDLCKYDQINHENLISIE